MDKDPEDVRYNFIRWLNNHVSTAIGPSCVHPETGQILDANIVLTNGWIRYFNESFQDYMPLVAMKGMNAESLAWLAQHPNWDPRIRFTEPSQRAHIGSKICSQLTQPHAGHRLLSGALRRWAMIRSTGCLDARARSTTCASQRPADALTLR